MSNYSEYLEFKNLFNNVIEGENKNKLCVILQSFESDYEAVNVGIKVKIVDGFSEFRNNEFAECLRDVLFNNRKGLLKKALDKYKRLEAKNRLKAIAEVKKELSL